MDQTTQVQLRYWRHWEHWCLSSGDVDPFFEGVNAQQRVAHLQGFAEWVRQGHAGRGHKVRVGSVQDALCSIGAAFELVAKPNPLYRHPATPRHWVALERQIRCYTREDPPTTPKLAVPVALPEHLVWQAHFAPGNRRTARRQALADLVNIAFYYLLRVGEYTATSSKRSRKKLTEVFRVYDVTFRKDGRIIPVTAPISDLMMADEATLRIRNQKMV